MSEKEKAAPCAPTHEAVKESKASRLYTSFLLYQFPAGISNERGIICLEMGNISTVEHFYINN
ncbi:hypothetical protein [Veillonella criceti]|uniref:hypothetical protein n=1 Tax=Veillonella criceti TaxID=103891 RepID=UPI0011C01A4C|nr:hypothetical protein [Veillonella criceti]